MAINSGTDNTPRSLGSGPARPGRMAANQTAAATATRAVGQANLLINGNHSDDLRMLGFVHSRIGAIRDLPGRIENADAIICRLVMDHLHPTLPVEPSIGETKPTEPSRNDETNPTTAEVDLPNDETNPCSAISSMKSPKRTQSDQDDTPLTPTSPKGEHKNPKRTQSSLPPASTRPIPNATVRPRLGGIAIA